MVRASRSCIASSRAPQLLPHRRLAFLDPLLIGRLQLLLRLAQKPAAAGFARGRRNERIRRRAFDRNRLAIGAHTRASAICVQRNRRRDGALDDILLSHRALQADGAFRFQLPDHRDDLLLRRLHFLDLDRPQGFHVFLQHLRAALRHALQKMIP